MPRTRPTDEALARYDELLDQHEKLPPGEARTALEVKIKAFMLANGIGDYTTAGEDHD